MAVNSGSALEAAIRDALTKEWDRIIAEEVGRAQERLAERMHEHIAKTAMSVAKFYEIQHDLDRLVITVRDGSKRNG